MQVNKFKAVPQNGKPSKNQASVTNAGYGSTAHRCSACQTSQPRAEGQSKTSVPSKLSRGACLTPIPPHKQVFRLCLQKNHMETFLGHLTHTLISLAWEKALALGLF